MSANRILLYGAAAVSASALLWAGFIRTVDADPGTLVRSAEMLLEAVQAMPETLDGQSNALRARFLREAERDLAFAARSVAAEGQRDGTQEDDDALVYIVECQGFARYLSGDRQGAIELYRQATLVPGCSVERKRSIQITVTRILLGGKRPGEALRSIEGIPLSGLSVADSSTLQLLRSEALLMQGASSEEVARPLARVSGGAGIPLDNQIRSAEIYDQIGMQADALAVLERAARTHEGARFSLARLKFRMGDVDGAVMALRALESKDPAALIAWLEREGMASLLVDPRLEADLDKGENSRMDRPFSAGKPGGEQPGKRAGTGSPARTEKELTR